VRYVVVQTYPSGKKYWQFRAPKDAKLAGVVTDKYWSDGRSARYEAQRMNQQIDDFRAGKLFGKHISQHSNMNVIINLWAQETDPSDTKKTFVECARNYIGSKTLEDVADPEKTNKLYLKWLKDYSVSHANQMLAGIKTVLDFCVLRKLIPYNALHSIQLERPERNKDVGENPWTHELISEVVDHCLSDVKTANFGVFLMLMAATLREAKTVAELTWDNVNVEEGELEIDGIVYELSDSLADLLRQQYERFGHQKYVVPHVRNNGGILLPYLAPSNTLAFFLKKLDKFQKGLDIQRLRMFFVKSRIESGDSPEDVRLSSGMSMAKIEALFKGLKKVKSSDIISFPRRKDT